jgi:UDPglucose 6-dehydrogenase
MKINNIGIVGLGFVGNAIYQNVKDKYTTKVYDLDPHRNIDEYLDTIQSDIVFVCLPTPMTSAEGGDCNTSILEKFFLNLPIEITKGVFVIKSTVPVGTTKKIQASRPDLKIVHNPEFLTAANAVNDFANSERNIVGGNLYDCVIVKSFLDDLFPNSLNIIVDSNESEVIKYFANTFLAIKVAYFNLMKDISDKYNMNYGKLVLGVCSDSRIGYSHAAVPGPDNDRGFGGTCFPKDINALIKTFEKNNLNCDILKSVWEYNKQVRKNWDWADNKSAVNGDK